MLPRTPQKKQLKPKTKPNSRSDALTVSHSDAMGRVITSVGEQQTKAAKAELERLEALFRRPANQD